MDGWMDGWMEMKLARMKVRRLTAAAYLLTDDAPFKFLSQFQLALYTVLYARRFIHTAQTNALNKLHMLQSSALSLHQPSLSPVYIVLFTSAVLTSFHSCLLVM